ncbi:MAG: hypothetical protein AAF800_10700 [Planctomycetota bacterium]
MRELARQLEGVRRRARWLLVGQRLMQAVAVAGPTLVTLGLIDYLLRLPGWLRGVVSLGLAGWLVWWLVHRLAGAWRFGPTVGALALRLENRYDALRGTLASALEFALRPERYAQPAATAALAAASVARAERSLAGVRVDKLIDLRPTRRFAGWGAGAVLVVGLLAWVMPTNSGIAASRWLAPWGDAAWPKRVAIAPAALPTVHPVDAPLVLRLDVTRGHRPGMRVWATARPADAPDAAPQRFLMTEQAAAPGSDRAEAVSGYAVSWRPPAEVVRRIGSGRGDAQRWLFTFAAADATADAVAVTLVARPAATALTIDVVPPSYAAGLVPPRTLNPPPASPRAAAVPALIGSSVEVAVRLNKKLPAAKLRPERLVPKLAGVPSLSVDAGERDRVRFSFVIDEPRQVELVLEDEHGLRPAEPTALRFDPREDRPPTVALLEPRADTSVLATAVVPVAARAADDVGVHRLVLDAAHPTRLDSAAEATQTVRTLAERVARQTELFAEATLDLAPLGLVPGDVVLVGAHAEDVYDLDGRTHGSVDATPRRLRVIDAATLIDQVRGELAGVRQQADRLERQQAQLIRRAGDRPATLRAEQARVSRGVAAQRQQLDTLTRRLTMNRLDEPSLDELIERADDLAAAAEAASDAAGEAFGEAEEPSVDTLDEAVARAEAQQGEAREQLEALADLLDQGRDALGLRLELSRLRTEQEALAQDTRELLPRAVGRSAEELPNDVREALEELVERQRALAEAAEDAVRRLQDTAESLTQSSVGAGEDSGADAEQREQDRAAAEALAEAAAVAQRQGLTPQMEQAERTLEENQLASAGGSQMQALDTLEAMMRQLDEGDPRRQERLRRRLAELAEQLQRLVNEQTAANEARRAEEDVARLSTQAEGQNRLWVRTIAAQTGAEGDEATAEVAPVIGQAVSAQARAVAALRAAEREPAAVGQAVALERLEEALRRIREQAAEAARDQTTQKRSELRQKYTELAERQRTLRGEVQEAVGDGPLTRRARAALRGLGGRQDEIGGEAEALGQEVAETVVFRRTHERIDATSDAASARLSSGTPDAGTATDDQERVAVLLESMAAALDDRAAQREFDSGAGAGGGGGGGGGEPQLIPPAAELRLLRGVQQAVYDQTRRLAEAGRVGGGNAARLDALGAEQRELSEMGTALIEQMNQPATPDVLPEGSPEDRGRGGR